VSDPLQDLTDVLTAQAEALRDLVPLLDAQQAALTRADTGAVASAVMEQAPILRRLMHLDRRRQTIAVAVAATVGAGPGPLSLSKLLARLPSPPRAITAVQRELKELLAAVDQRNRRNAFLLQRAMACIDGLMQTLSGPVLEPAPVYVATGQPAAPRTTARLLDRNA
jgi:flagellar biosynthesis/type III secretory pathway chaperone